MTWANTVALHWRKMCISWPRLLPAIAAAVASLSASSFASSTVDRPSAMSCAVACPFVQWMEKKP
eukprot:8900437-Heterocapsa_arctica.AAC.1